MDQKNATFFLEGGKNLLWRQPLFEHKLICVNTYLYIVQPHLPIEFSYAKFENHHFYCSLTVTKLVIKNSWLMKS